MKQFEHELRELFARRQAPEGFTASVMERVRAEAKTQSRGSVVELPRRPFRNIWRWTAAAGLAASLSIGLYVRDQNRRVADQRAETELLNALQIAGLKIGEAREMAMSDGRRGE